MLGGHKAQTYSVQVRPVLVERVLVVTVLESRANTACLDNKFALEHLEEVTRFVVLSDTDLGSLAAKFIVDLHGNESGSACLILSGVGALPEVHDMAFLATVGVVVLVVDHVRVSAVEDVLVRGNGGTLEVFNTPDLLLTRAIINLHADVSKNHN